MSKRSKSGFLLIVVFMAFVQSVALGKIIYDRASLLQNGKEVVLESGFIDPRDLFRGHYVILNLMVGSEIEEGNIAPDLKRNDPVYLSLIKGDSIFWKAGKLTANVPYDAASPILKGEWRGLKFKEGREMVRFPFDRYFAPKLRAKALEKLQRDRKLGVVLALDEKGNGAIKGIVVDGKLVYDEPLW